MKIVHCCWFPPPSKLGCKSTRNEIHWEMKFDRLCKKGGQTRWSNGPLWWEKKKSMNMNPHLRNSSLKERCLQNPPKHWLNFLLLFEEEKERGRSQAGHHQRSSAGLWLTRLSGTQGEEGGGYWKKDGFSLSRFLQQQKQPERFTSTRTAVSPGQYHGRLIMIKH